MRHVASAALALAILAAAFAGEAEAPPAAGPSLKDLLEKLPFGLHGFVETRAGTRVRRDPYISETASIGEARLQLEATKTLEIGDHRPDQRLKADFYYDAIEKRAIADLREANIVFSPAEFLDLKLGRQVLTWGTGDLLFINDLFPKDWESFLIGRDDEYLKAPSDAAKLSFFTDAVNVDLVYTPRFRSDKYVDGERLSYWSDALGSLAGENAVVRDREPHRWFRDDELALRLYRNLSGYEVALYGYRGFWRAPAGMDPMTGKATFPRLSVYGGSVRGPVGKGIGNLEVGYYDSRDDRGGANPLVRNSEARFLAGYEQEVARDLTAGVQYYLEWMRDYGDYRRTLPAGVRPRDEFRHVVTARLTQLLMNQNLRLSLFVFYSPSDSDAYLRPKALYKIDDHWSAEVGGNLFFGARDHTFFGQFEENSNVYGAVRFSF
ncbi:MAG TPA: hypothetical protein P5532_12530 [Planctomycetota bacterium]|nr:hypothetical protein [Planctomycetota bacterium]